MTNPEKPLAQRHDNEKYMNRAMGITPRPKFMQIKHAELTLGLIDTEWTEHDYCLFFRGRKIMSISFYFTKTINPEDA